MKLYEIVSEVYTSFYSVGELEPPETSRDWAVVAADSAGKARYLFANFHRYDSDPREWPKLSVKKVANLIGDAWVPAATNGPLSAGETAASRVWAAYDALRCYQEDSVGDEQ